MTIAPTDEQQEVMKKAFLDHEHVDQVGETFSAGLMGHQLEIHLTDVDDYRFYIYVEDVDLNCEWDIVKLSSGRYDPEFPNEGLVATVEVRRFPEVAEE